MSLRIFGRTPLFILLVVLIGISAACVRSEMRNNRPKVLISQATLTKVITEVHLIEAAMNMRRNNGQEFEQQKNALYDSLFVNHSLTPQLLEDNLVFYNKRPEIMEKVYQNVIDSLMNMQKNLRVEDIPTR